MFGIEYIPRLNKYLYKKLVQVNVNNPDAIVFDVYIKPITAGIFLGFENGVEYLITEQGTYSSKFINLSGYTSMIVKMEGDASLDNTISNISNKEFVYDKILGIFNIADVAPMDSIRYEDSDGCMFRHKINSQKIPSFKIKIVNEDGVQFPQMADWIMMLKFQKVRKSDAMVKVESLLDNMNYMMSSIYAYMGIPSRITLEDVLNTE